jgi:pimeloyl-ACP methyl ester carboxylesterase
LTEPRLGEVRYLLAGAFYRMAYWEWGQADAPVVLCVHGLTRTGRDFDPLAEALADRYRVVCPDLPGRGASEWLHQAKLYEPLGYLQALSHLMAAIGREIAWIGTSLGGLCGMMMAAAQNAPITRLVLNDVGPMIPAAALRRISDYVAHKREFPDLDALEDHIRRIHAPFGELTDAQWTHLARHSARELPDGTLAMHYDPEIGRAIRGFIPIDVDMSGWWRRIRVPVMAIRGEESDLLLPRTFARMAREGARTLTVAGAGHAPALMDAPTIAEIRAFLDVESSA